MSKKQDTDLNTFITNINKRGSKLNGRKIRFSFTKRKRS